MKTIAAVTSKQERIQTVRDIVNPRNCLLSGPSEKVSDIVRAMHGHHSGAAGVVDAEDRFIGLITEREILRRLFRMVPESFEQRRFAEESKAVMDLTAWDIMIAGPKCLDPDLPLQKAFEVITDYGFRYMPVVQDDKILGIVSEREIFLHTQAQKEQELAAKDSLLTYLMHHETYGSGARL